MGKWKRYEFVFLFLRAPTVYLMWVQVTQVFKEVRQQVPKAIARRRVRLQPAWNAPFNMCCCSSLSDQTWKKFGDATDDNPKGPDQATTVIADDVYLTLTTNKEVSIIPLIECTVTRRGVKESSLWWVLCNVLVLVKGWEEWMERICMYIHAYMFARDYECVVNGSGPMAAYWG